jgi:cellobiose transport system substrate-binding protein
MPTRRDFLRLATAGAGLSLLTGCGVLGDGGVQPGDLTLWYLNRSINDNLLKQVTSHVAGVRLVPEKIGSAAFRTKLMATLAGRSNVPDLATLNSDIASYFPDSDQFVDLYDFGARDIQGDYLPWKWGLGVTPEGKCVGIPTDTGPTALMYRSDVFQKAGLPTDPDILGPMVASWDGYFEVGTRLRKLPGTYLVNSIVSLFAMAMASSPQQYLDRSGKFIGDQAHVRDAWNHAVKANELKVTARIADGTPDWNAGITSGSIAAVQNGAWESFTIAKAAPSTTGKWGVCTGPGGAGNNGGSFMAVTKYCKDPAKAFKVIKWLQSPANQTKSYVTNQLFPSAVSSLASPALSSPNAFYRGQRIGEVFIASAKNIKPVYYSPYDGLVSPSFNAQLANVESLGKDPDKAWEDAVSDAKRQLEHVAVI